MEPCHDRQDRICDLAPLTPGRHSAIILPGRNSATQGRSNQAGGAQHGACTLRDFTALLMPSFLKPTQPGVDMTSVGRFLMLSVVGLFLVSSEVSAGMFGFGKKYDVELFPAVEGRIARDGVPLEGVTIVREATYDDAELQETETGPDGRFYFPSWTIQSRTPGKPFTEARLRQVVAAEYQERKYLLWYYVTDSIETERVVAEKLHTLDCDLTNDEISHHFPVAENPSFTHNVASICRWPE